jgi:hypothetical protein
MAESMDTMIKLVSSMTDYSTSNIHAAVKAENSKSSDFCDIYGQAVNVNDEELDLPRQYGNT